MPINGATWPLSDIAARSETRSLWIGETVAFEDAVVRIKEEFVVRVFGALAQTLCRRRIARIAITAMPRPKIMNKVVPERSKPTGRKAKA